MSAAVKEHLRLTETAEWASIELPPKPPNCRFCGGSRMDRILTYAALFLLVLVDLGVASLIGKAFDARIYRKYPLDNALNILIAGCYAFGGLCIIAPTVAMNIGYVLGFFHRRIVIHVCSGWMVEHILRGPRRRVRRFDTSAAKWVALVPPPNVNWSYLQEPLDERSTRVLLQSTVDTRKNAFEITGKYPLRLAREVAETLAKQISQRSTNAGVEVVDTTDPVFLNRDDLSEPTGCDMIV